MPPALQEVSLSTPMGQIGAINLWQVQRQQGSCRGPLFGLRVEG